MERDPKVLVMGEDVGKLGGVFRITDGLQKDFGEERVLDTPLAESGSSVRLSGWPFADTGRCARSSSTVRLPRVRPDRLPAGQAALPLAGAGADAGSGAHPFGGGIGAVEHHSESPESLFAHVAGLRVVACGNRWMPTG